ncbi:hypothetical protein FAP59_18155 [Morganella morganii]|nr:hypothetical protein [Morganella morganii]
MKMKKKPRNQHRNRRILRMNNSAALGATPLLPVNLEPTMLAKAELIIKEMILQHGLRTGAGRSKVTPDEGRGSAGWTATAIIITTAMACMNPATAAGTGRDYHTTKYSHINAGKDTATEETIDSRLHKTETGICGLNALCTQRINRIRRSVDLLNSTIPPEHDLMFKVGRQLDIGSADNPKIGLKSGIVKAIDGYDDPELHAWIQAMNRWHTQASTGLNWAVGIQGGSTGMVQGDADFEWLASARYHAYMDATSGVRTRIELGLRDWASTTSSLGSTKYPDRKAVDTNDMLYQGSKPKVKPALLTVGWGVSGTAIKELDGTQLNTYYKPGTNDLLYTPEVSVDKLVSLGTGNTVDLRSVPLQLSATTPENRTVNVDGPVMVGNEITAGVNSVTIGNRSSSESGGVAVGTGANVSSGPDGVAVGKGAHAVGTNSVALGAGSEAGIDTVSFGNDTLKRRVTNIADGVADSDGASMRQLKAVDEKISGLTGLGEDLEGLRKAIKDNGDADISRAEKFGQEMKNVNARVDDTKAELSKTSNRLASFTMTTEQELDEHHRGIVSAKLSIDETKTELGKTKQTVDNLDKFTKDEFKKTATSIEGANKRIDETKTELSETNHTVKVLTDKTEDRFKKTDIRISNANKRIDETKTELSETNQTVKALTDYTKENFVKTNTRISDANKRIDDTNAKLDETNSELKTFKDRTNQRFEDTDKTIKNMYDLGVSAVASANEKIGKNSAAIADLKNETEQKHREAMTAVSETNKAITALDEKTTKAITETDNRVGQLDKKFTEGLADTNKAVSDLHELGVLAIAKVNDQFKEQSETISALDTRTTEQFSAAKTQISELGKQTRESIAAVNKDIEGVKISTVQQISDAKSEVTGYVDRVKDEAVEEMTGYVKTVRDKITDETNENISKAMDRVATSGNVLTAVGIDSYAAGKEAKALGENSVALGAKSRADNANEMNIGVWTFIRTEETAEEPDNPQFRSGPFVQGEYVQTGTRLLSGLSDGVKADDAVNKGQLDALDTRARSYAGKAQEAAVSEANKYTDTEIGKSEAKNVALAQDVLNYSGEYARQVGNNAVIRSNNYTDRRFGELKKEIDKNRKQASAGIAGVTAISSIPYVSGERFSFGMALGNYMDSQAIAAGIQYKPWPSTNVRFNASVNDGGDSNAGVGIAIGW